MFAQQFLTCYKLSRRR